MREIFSMRARGRVSEDDINRILVTQEDTQEKFVNVIARKKILTKKQAKELLRDQEDTHCFFAEPLVQCGAIPEEILFEQIKEFNRQEFLNLQL